MRAKPSIFADGRNMARDRWEADQSALAIELKHFRPQRDAAVVNVDDRIILYTYAGAAAIRFSESPLGANRATELEMHGGKTDDTLFAWKLVSA